MAASSQTSLVPPLLQQAMAELVNKYGADAVKEAVRAATRKKRGPKTLKDWSAMRQPLEEDARTWLNGGVLIGKRSNSQIAKETMQAFPGHSQGATYRRLMDKLSRGRATATLVAAWFIVEREQPYQRCLAALKAIANYDHELRGFAEDRSERLCRTVNDYREIFDIAEPDVPLTEMRKRLAALPPRGIGSGLLKRKHPEICVDWSDDEGVR